MWIFLCLQAEAHRPGLSYARIQPDLLDLTFARPELEGIAPLSDLQAARFLLSDATLKTVTITVEGQVCTLEEPTVQAVEGDGIQLSAALHCPPGKQWKYEAGFLKQMEVGHRHYLEAFDEPVAVMDPQHFSVEFTGEAQPVAIPFLKLGVEHIWTGYDHLLFLFCLLLAIPRLRDMLLVVTGFTIAHSITLTLAATGRLSLPPSLVEPAIAATIAFVGIENFFNPPPRRRVVITFFLGLIHGFGFAGALAELGLPQHALVLALVCFNGGVELGQAAVVLLLLPLLLFCRRSPYWERGMQLGSLAAVLAGFYWMVERIWGG